MFLSTPGPPGESAKAEAPLASAHHNSVPGRPLGCRSIGPPRQTSALLDRSYHGELLGLLGAADALQDALPLEGDLVDELECGDGLVVDAPGDFLLLDEVEEVGPDVVASQVLG